MFISLGEYLADLFVNWDSGETTDTVAVKIGGSPLNIAIAAARLGVPAGFMCPLSSDSFGRRARDTLKRDGVRPLIELPVDAPTAIAVIQLTAEGQPKYSFHRHGTADRALDPTQLIDAIPDDCKALQFGSLCLVKDADWITWRAVVAEANRRDAVIAFDPNVRPALIDNLDDYRGRVRQALELCHILKLSDEDLGHLAPGHDPNVLIPQWMNQYHLELAILTGGSKATNAWHKSGLHVTETPPQMAPIQDTVGAGDTFQGAAMSWLYDAKIHPRELGEETLLELLRFAHTAAALNCQRVGCTPPTKPEVLAHLN